MALQLFCFPQPELYWQEHRNSTHLPFVRTGLLSSQAAAVLHVQEGVLQEATAAAMGDIKSHTVQQVLLTQRDQSPCFPEQLSF